MNFTMIKLTSQLLVLCSICAILALCSVTQAATVIRRNDDGASIQLAQEPIMRNSLPPRLQNLGDIKKNDAPMYKITHMRYDRKRRDTDIGSNRLFMIEVPPSEMKQVIGMANFAMQTLDQIDVDNYKRKVVKVLTANKQLTPDGSGIMYYLDVNTQDTQCPEDLPSDDLSPLDPPVDDKCFSHATGLYRTCKISLLRSWVPNSSPVNAHVVKSECGPPEETGP